MTQRHYLHLGKLLCAEYPEIAKQLKQQIDEETPIFSSLSLLPQILDYFCCLKGITTEQVKGEECGRLSQKTDNKHLFIAIVVKLFSPATLGPTKEILLSKLRHELSILLNTRGDRISRIIANVRFYLKAYKEFAAEVDEKYEHIINSKHEFKESKKV